MIYSLIAALFVTAIVAIPTTEAEYQSLFSQFIMDYERTYASEDFFHRFNIFRNNVDHINTVNSNSSLSFTLAINQFTDLTQEEWSSTYFGYNFVDNSYARSQNAPTKQPNLLHQVRLADSLDWVEKGAVTPVKNQGQCGSCWSFSATGSMEGALQIASGNLVSLSEQQLVDCAGAQGNMGCSGGLMDNAFEYVIKQGLTSEESYPYTAKDGTCEDGHRSVISISGYQDVNQNDEDDLMRAINIGPVSVAIEADRSAFQSYNGGVLDSIFCGQQLDHGVLLVGYGTDPDSGKDYWKVKNSWGESWGEEGFIRMVRGKNMCGIAAQPSYPTGASAPAQ